MERLPYESLLELYKCTQQKQKSKDLRCNFLIDPVILSLYFTSVLSL